MVFQIEPAHFRDCDSFIRECKRRLEILSMSSHKDEDVRVEYDGSDAPSINSHISEPGRSESLSEVKELTINMQNTTIAEN